MIFTDEEKVVTNSLDVGDVTESLPSTLVDHGNSTAPDVKQSTNKFNELDSILSNFVPEKKAFGLTCSVRKILEQLPVETQNKLNVLMDNKEVHAGDICRILKSFNLLVSTEVMRRHRRRRTGTGCSCP